MGIGIKRCVFGVLVILLTVFAAPSIAQGKFSAYTGKYKMYINGYTAYLNVFIENGKLKAKQSWDGKTKNLEYLADNKFIISMYGWAIRFKRNKQNKVVQMEVLGNEIWIREK